MVEIYRNAQRGFNYTEFSYIGVISQWIQLLFYSEFFFENVINDTNVTYTCTVCILAFISHIGETLARRRSSNNQRCESATCYLMNMIYYTKFIVNKTRTIKGSQENTKESSRVSFIKRDQ